MSIERLGVAIVGCGTIGHTHIAAVSEFVELKIVALVDVVEQSAVRFADAIEASGESRPSIYTELTQALEDRAVDLVIIATPTGLHIELGLAVLAAGKHLIIEKPLDVDLVQAQDIETAALAAAERGIISSVISQHRFDPASKIVAAALAANRFGRLTSAIASVAWWRSQDYYDAGDWRGTWAMDGGGALMNQGVHTVDLLLWFMGRPVEIFAHTGLLAHRRVEIEDVAVATIRFESGALAVLHASTAAYPGLTVRMQVMGSAGSAIIDGDELAYFHAADAGEDVGSSGLGGGGNQAAELLGVDEVRRDFVVNDPIAYPEGHLRQYEDILRAIHEGTEPAVRISDAVLALAAVRAIYISATVHAPGLFDDVITGKYNGLKVRTEK